jgi:hypothetical protein
LNQGTIIVGWNCVCPMGIDLTVGDDLAVTGSGGTSCGVGQVTNLRLCAPHEVRAEPVAGWSLDRVSGQIDAESGVMQLQVTGHRADLPVVYFDNGHVVGDRTPGLLFPVPFSLMPDDGATRSFGPDPNARDGQTVFTLHAR